MKFWISVLTISVMQLSTIGPGTAAFADEEHREGVHAQQLDRLERAAMELDELISDAREDENEPRVENLSRRRESLVEEMEAIERLIRAREEEEEEEEEDWERQERREEAERRRESERHEHESEHHEHESVHHELEEHKHHLELRAIEIEVQNLELKLQKNRLELELLRQEAATRMANFATNQAAMTVIAIQRLMETAEQPEHAGEVLTGLLGRTDDPVTRRIIQLQLAQVWMVTGRPERAREALSQLISAPANGRRPRERARGRGPESAPRPDFEVPERVRRVFETHDANRDEIVSFDEWIRMKEDKMTPDRLEREQQLFGELAGDDGRINMREFVRWMERRRRPESRDGQMRDRIGPLEGRDERRR